MKILVCNVGSTSLKFKAFTMPNEEALVESKIERIGKEDAIFSYSVPDKGIQIQFNPISIPDYESGIRLFFDYLLSEENGIYTSLEELDAVGFKTVLAKGCTGTHELTDDVLKAMEEYITVAPAHNPPYLKAIKVFKEVLPNTLLVGCFETGFHQTIPLHRRVYALPYSWYEEYGVQKYGYHGASHSYIASELTRRFGDTYKAISCHLGGSGSLCAIQDGKSVQTSFGFSLQVGIPQSNRSGDMDPYIIRYLLEKGLSLDEIYHGIDHEGGLLGLSGISNDLRDIQKEADLGNERANLALDAYVDSLVQYIGSYAALMNGLDYIVFTGGIGENSTYIRSKVLTRLSFLGVELDPQLNQSELKDKEITTPNSHVKALVIPTNEELGIAKKIESLYK